MNIEFTTLERASTKQKNLVIALLSSLLFLGLIIFAIHPWLAYLIILVASPFTLKYISPPSKTKIFNRSAVVTYLIFLCFIIFSYYYQFVRDLPSTPNLYVAIAVPPVFITLFLAPLIEELGCRRILLSSLLNSGLHWLAACSISAVLFALYHPGSNQVYALVLGLLFSFAYKSTGKIWVAVCMHFLANAIYFVDPASFGASHVICDPCLRF